MLYYLDWIQSYEPCKWIWAVCFHLLFLFLDAVFKYKKGSNSVLVVTKEDYYSCNNKNPIQSLTDGESIFKFNHSGPFFFISSNVNNCQNGQKLIAVVLALKHEHVPVPSPPVASPDSGSNPSNLDNAPTPPIKENSGLMLRFKGLDVGLVLCISIGVSMVFS